MSARSERSDGGIVIDSGMPGHVVTARRNRPTMGAIEDFTARVYGRLGQRGPASPWGRTSAAGRKQLAHHLATTYGVDVAKVSELESVFRVDLTDGSRWIARVNPALRPLDVVDGDAEILRFLEHHGYPAERLAHERPVSVLGDRPVIVTHFVGGSSPAPTGTVMHRMGSMLGRLHSLSADTGAMARPAGSWHALSYAGGGRRADVESLRPLLEDAAAQVPERVRPIYERLKAELDALDLCEDLPHALIHIDFGGPNLLQTADGELVPIDWAGAGRGPRVHSINTVLYASGGRADLIDAFVAGYREHVQLEPEELERLGSALRAHGLVLTCWGAAFAKERIEAMASAIDRDIAACDSVAAHVRKAFAADASTLAGWESAPAPVDMGPYQLLVDAVRDKSEDEIAAFAEMFGGYTHVCSMVLNGMRDTLHPKDDCNVAWVLGDGMGWTTKATGGAVKVSKRVAKRVNATVSASPADFLRLMTQSLDWDTAIIDGRARVDGDPDEVTKLFADSPFVN